LTNLKVRTLAVEGNKIIAGTANGLFFSYNNGDNWVQKDSGIQTKYIQSILINGNKIFISTIYGLYLSIDDGTSWNIQNLGFDNIFMYSLVNTGNNIFASADSYAVFLSTDSGDTWAQKNSGFFSNSVYGLGIYGDWIFAATYGAGVYRAKLSDFGITSVEDTPSPISEQAPLLYPNPVHDKLNIHLNSEATTLTQIQIFDIFGQQVAWSIIPVGSSDNTINIESLPVGTYLLKVGDRVEKVVKF
jgi:hypothetical protein